jgi:regulatory protein
MLVITALQESGRRPGRYAVAVDGEALATVSVEAISALRLHVGRTLTAGELERLREEGEVVAAYDRALDLLAFRPRAAAELRRRLVQKGIVAARAEAAVGRLVEQGLVDDRAFALAVTRSKALGGGASRRRIGQELARRGVDRETADAAVEEVWRDEEVDQSETVERLARKRLGALRGLEAGAQRRRLYAFLARRGYDADEIRRALDAALAGGERDEDGADAAEVDGADLA